MLRLFLLFVLFFMGFSLPAQLPAYVPECGLLAWYSFAGNPADNSANHNNGMVHNAVLTEDRFGADDKAYYFDGADSYISSSATADNTGEHQKLSVAAWIKPFGFGDDSLGVIVSQREDLNKTGFRMAYDRTGGVTFTVRTESVHAPVPPGSWHNIICVYDDTAMRIYVDGKLSAHAFTSINFKGSAEPVYIGSEDARPRHFKGAISDVGIWNRPLSTAEALQVYNDTALITVDATVAVGKTIKLAPSMANGRWSSSSASIATVDEHGSVTGISAGRAIIWYSADDDCGHNTMVARLALKVSFSESGAAVQVSSNLLPQPPLKKAARLPDTIMSLSFTGEIRFLGIPAIKLQMAQGVNLPLVTVRAFSADELMPVLICPLHIAMPRLRPIEAFFQPPASPALVLDNHIEEHAVSISADAESQQLTIVADSSEYSSFTIKGRGGEAIIKQVISTASTKVDISKLPPGNYFIFLEGAGGSKGLMFVKEE